MLSLMAKPKKQSSEPVKTKPKDAVKSRAVPLRSTTVPAEPEKPPAETGFDKYLRQLASMPIREDALKNTGLTAQDIRRRAEEDPDFSRALDKAWDIGVDVAEDAAFKRAIVGWDEPVFTKDGGLAGHVTRYDGGLLKEVLKANRAKYRGEDVGRSRGVSPEARREVDRVFEEAGALS
jgi:hypothetical protein